MKEFSQSVSFVLNRDESRLLVQFVLFRVGNVWLTRPLARPRLSVLTLRLRTSPLSIVDFRS